MKATDLAKVIFECDIHALTDYYSFFEVEIEDASNNMKSIFGYENESQKHVPKGMYLWLSSIDDEHEEFMGILRRVFGEKYIIHIFFENGRDIILKIED